MLGDHRNTEMPHMCSAGDVAGVNKGGHGQSGATAHKSNRHIMHGTLAGEAER